MKDVETVARSLTDAQRAMLLELRQGQPREYSLGRTGFALMRMKLVFVNELGARHLTDDGHIVARHIKAAHAGAD